MKNTPFAAPGLPVLYYDSPGGAIFAYANAVARYRLRQLGLLVITA